MDLQKLQNELEKIDELINNTDIPFIVEDLNNAKKKIMQQINDIKKNNSLSNVNEQNDNESRDFLKKKKKKKRKKKNKKKRKKKKKENKRKNKLKKKKKEQMNKKNDGKKKQLKKKIIKKNNKNNKLKQNIHFEEEKKQEEVEFVNRLIRVVRRKKDTGGKTHRKDLVYTGLEINKYFLDYIERKANKEGLMYGNYFIIPKTMSVSYFFEQIKESQKKNDFASECTHFMSACDLEFFIYKQNIELHDVDVGDIEIRKKGQLTINNKFSNNELKFDERNNVFNITNNNT